MTTRRQFLTSVGAGALAAITGSPSFAAPAMPLPRPKEKPPAFFTPIEPSSADRLVLAKEFKWDLVIKWNDPLGSKSPLDESPELFGFNCDFNAFFPIDALEGGGNSDEGLLWTNHEYPHPVFVSDFPAAPASEDDSPAYKQWLGIQKSAEQVMKEKLSVGGSITHIKRTKGVWKPVVPSPYNKRFTAAYPEIAFTGPAAQRLKSATGTLANCSGGRTPWHTTITCEENYPDFNSRGRFDFRWVDAPGMKIDENRYGWIVEVDPFGKLPPKKHSALGRFKHENASCLAGPNGKFVVYMGDDEVDQHLYKFVSDKPLPKDGPREEQSKVLESGTLYAADMAKGKWIPLVFNEKNKAIIEKSAGYKEAFKADSTIRIESQADMLIHTRICAKALGATPLDRCEDCEVHPLDKSLYVALTNNTRHGNFYGHIVRLVEDNDNCEGNEFTYEVFLAGGPQTGLACPDNLAFDKDGNLWVVCDISSDKLAKPLKEGEKANVYAPFKNNGLFVVPTSGESAGQAFQFASGPIQAELTGPWFSDDGSTLFLSVQHPGEESRSAANPTSHWPSGKKEDIPHPAVVAITGFKK